MSNFKNVIGELIQLMKFESEELHRLMDTSDNMTHGLNACANDPAKAREIIIEAAENLSPAGAVILGAGLLVSIVEAKEKKAKSEFNAEIARVQEELKTDPNYR